MSQNRTPQNAPEAPAHRPGQCAAFGCPMWAGIKTGGDQWLPALIPVFVRFRESNKAPTEDLEGMATALQPLADGLAALKDEDAEYVIGACLSVVQRKQPTGWARVWNGALMFDDMDLATILPLAVQVITANLGPFIQGLLTSQQSGPEATQAG